MKLCKTCKYWQRRTTNMGICRKIAEDMPIRIAEDGCDEHEPKTKT